MKRLLKKMKHDKDIKNAKLIKHGKSMNTAIVFDFKGNRFLFLYSREYNRFVLYKVEESKYKGLSLFTNSNLKEIKAEIRNEVKD